MDIEEMAIVGQVAPVMRGKYSPTEIYEELHAVYYKGSMYIALKQSTGILPTNEEFWMLSAGGVSGEANEINYDNTESKLTAENAQAALDELAGKTEIAQAPSAENPDGKLGIIKPDGKTIKVDENGLIVGAASGLTLTEAEAKEKIKNGEIEEGTIVNITDDYENAAVIDKELSLSSENPVQNKVITAALGEISGAMGGITFSVTEAGLVRASWEEPEQEGL